MTNPNSLSREHVRRTCARGCVEAAAVESKVLLSRERRLGQGRQWGPSHARAHVRGAMRFFSKRSSHVGGHRVPVRNHLSARTILASLSGAASLHPTPAASRLATAGQRQRQETAQEPTK